MEELGEWSELMKEKGRSVRERERSSERERRVGSERENVFCGVGEREELERELGLDLRRSKYNTLHAYSWIGLLMCVAQWVGTTSIASVMCVAQWASCDAHSYFASHVS